MGWNQWQKSQVENFPFFEGFSHTVHQIISNVDKILQLWHSINLTMECRQSGTSKARVTARQYNVRHGKFII